MNANDKMFSAHLPLVLLVDDELRSREAMRRTLEEEFRIVIASDSEAARNALEHDEVAVILCDQRMPGQTGVEFLKEVRARWPEVVRIVVSGYVDSEDILAGINEAGIYQYLIKPWVPDHLLQTVRSAVQASRLHHGLHRIELDLRAGADVLEARRHEKLKQAGVAIGFQRMVRA
ncbi:MAG: response regulator, partial [Rhodoferax sp.]